MTRKITPVVLCGGCGSRLWPMSRKSYPKQFATFSGAQSPFQASLRRVQSVDYAPPVVVTHCDYRFLAADQMAEAGMHNARIIAEPAARNTAAAIYAAALVIARDDPRALLLVLPADHDIPDQDGFDRAIREGRKAAEVGALVTFGVQPDRPEIGYGYLELSAPLPSTAPVPQALVGFVEKPDVDRAQQMLDAGRYLWNAGIFLFSARAIIEAFETHAPDLLPPVTQAVDEARPCAMGLQLASAPWEGVRDISIDYAVMEKATNLAVVPLSGSWQDLGDWEAVWRSGPADANGVVCAGDAMALECHNSLLHSETDDVAVVGLGLRDTVVVATRDAVLVADKSRVQEVKHVVRDLRRSGRAQADQFPRDHRPWGWFEQIATGDRFQVKRMHVIPGGVLSLQSHQHRSEHWVVVSGTAQVTLGEDQQMLYENQSIFVPQGARHRLHNPGKIPLVLIEVQTGSYLGEDDITRYEDLYQRD